MAEIAAGVGLVWARRDWVGVPVAAVVPSALSVLTALVPVDVAAPSSTVSAVAFVLAPSSALPVSLLLATAAPAARLLPEAGWLPRWPPWVSSRRPWTCTRSRRAGSKGVVS